MVRVEAACLALAGDAGLVVPAFRVETFGRHAALLIERFDITEQGSRFQVLSMQTLLGAEGFYRLGYADLEDVLRLVSRRPEADIPALYRQMVFNAIIGNTDDHLKNFALLHDGMGWRLTPAYDLTPDVLLRGEYVLHFGAAGHRPDVGALADMAGAFGLSRPRSRCLIDEVSAAVASWHVRFDEQEVGSRDQQRLAPDFERRLRSGLRV